jgi:hypothetical protein
MNSLMEQLHDIEGIDAIGWWPLAIGWWIVIGVSFAILCFCVCLFAYWLAYRLSWRYDAISKLHHLERTLTDASARDSLIALSEYLRRIVLRRYERNECASLTGEAWLKWLSGHDPKKFDWETRGALLIEAPYAPANHCFGADQVRVLIEATKRWVK